jgi:hypothetical protein
MKMLASPGGWRAALITAITYARNFTFAMHTSATNFSTHLLGLFPVSVLVGELSQVPKLELYRGHLRRADKTLVIFVLNALAFLEIDH